MLQTETKETEDVAEKGLTNELYRLGAIMRATHNLVMDLNGAGEVDPEKSNDADHLAEEGLNHLKEIIEYFCSGPEITPSLIRAGDEVLHKVEPPREPSLEEKKASLEMMRRLVKMQEAEIAELEEKGKEAKGGKNKHDKEA